MPCALPFCAAMWHGYRMVSAPIRAPSTTANLSRPVSSMRELDAKLVRLADHARAFARAAPRTKTAWLAELAERLLGLGPKLARAGCEAKGLDPDGPIAAEEWFLGPVLIGRNLRYLRRSLADVASCGAPRVPRGAREGDEGRAVVEVFPVDGFDRAMFRGLRCETWLDARVPPGDLAEHQASFYRRLDPPGSVCLVLGAGNVASIPAMDVLYKMFVQGSVCLVKLNPVNDYLGPFFSELFAPLVERGYVEFAYGGTDVGAYLTDHELVDSVHLTGSLAVHDAIVWGAEPDAAKASGTTRLAKPVTSELGNVSPLLVVPGRYTEREFCAVADMIATSMVYNSSFNCVSGRLLVLPRGWEQGAALVDRLAAVLESVPPRRAYYPGAESRFSRHTQGRTRLRSLGRAGPGELPWTLILDVDATARSESLFSEEAFCPVLGVCEVGSGDPLDFLQAATSFVNERVWGTLNADCFVAPASLSDPAVSAGLGGAIAKLRYGMVGVNQWTGVGFGLSSPPWGGHPSSTLENAQSGIGWVHNTFMLEQVEKSVLWGLLCTTPKHVWLAGHRSAHRIARRLLEFDLDPAWRKLAGIAAVSVLG